MRVRRKHIAWLAAGLVSIVALVGVLQPSAITVETALVARGPLRVTIDEEGETRLKRRFAVSAPVAGRVLRIEAQPGDSIRAGATVAVIAPARAAPLDERARLMAEARISVAEAALERARAERRRLGIEADQAGRESERLRTLNSAGAASREDVELAEARVRTAAEALGAADAAIRAAQFALAEARAALVTEAGLRGSPSVAVRAPISGVILKRLQESEGVVQAGAPLLEIGDLRDLEIVSDLLSSDAVRVTSGNAVIVTRWGGDRDLTGRVARVEPAGFTKISALGVEEQRVNTIIEFVDPPASRATLGDGFRVEVHIAIADLPSVLKVPVAGLFRLNGRWASFVVENNRAVRREVRIGHQNDREAEVLEGLVEGARVVLYPGESLTDGALVAAR